MIGPGTGVRVYLACGVTDIPFLCCCLINTLAPYGNQLLFATHCTTNLQHFLGPNLGPNSGPNLGPEEIPLYNYFTDTYTAFNLTTGPQWGHSGAKFGATKITR
jgi:hypothetical protein